MCLGYLHPLAGVQATVAPANLPISYNVAQQKPRSAHTTIPASRESAQSMNSMQRDTRLALAHRAGNSFAFGYVVDAIDIWKPYFFDAVAGPLNLELINFIYVA